MIPSLANAGSPWDEGDPGLPQHTYETPAAACKAAPDTVRNGFKSWNIVLAACYERGIGVRKDISEAARLYGLAMAEHSAAKARFGMMIVKGEIQGDVADGVAMVRAVAEDGDSEAAFLWSSLLHTGRGVARDEQEALRWLRRAADGRSVVAAETLASLHETGTLVPQNPQQAKQWREKADALRPDIPPKPFTSTPITPENQALRRRMQKAGADGDIKEYFRLAKFLAEQGDANAQGVVGTFYDSGDIVALDYLEAERWYRKAVAQGDSLARLRLALLIGRKQIPGDEKEAFQLARGLALEGRPEGEFLLATMLGGGRGVEADPIEAVYWLRRAALHGIPGAAHNLAVAYYDGSGVPRDLEQAQRWLEKAGRGGVKLAREAYCTSVAAKDFAGTASLVRDWCDKPSR